MDERVFVRSKYQITHDSPDAKGKRNTESECIKEFGETRWKSMLIEIDDMGSALLNDKDSALLLGDTTVFDKPGLEEEKEFGELHKIK